MSAKAGDKALSGEQEEIRGYKFKIIEDITIIFKGRLCNIKNSKGKLVKELGIYYIGQNSQANIYLNSKNRITR